MSDPAGPSGWDIAALIAEPTEARGFLTELQRLKRGLCNYDDCISAPGDQRVASAIELWRACPAPSQANLT